MIYYDVLNTINFQLNPTMPSKSVHKKYEGTFLVRNELFDDAFRNSLFT